MLELFIESDKKINAFVMEQLKKEINKMCIAKRSIKRSENVIEINCFTKEKELEFGYTLHEYLKKLIQMKTITTYDLTYKVKIEKDMLMMYNEDGFNCKEDAEDGIEVTLVKLYDGDTKAALINNKNGVTFSILLDRNNLKTKEEIEFNLKTAKEIQAQWEREEQSNLNKSNSF